MILKLGYDGPLSNLAFNFNLRRYGMARAVNSLLPPQAQMPERALAEVGFYILITD